MRKALLPALALALVLVGAADIGARSGSATELIAFVDTRPDRELLVKRADGTDERRIASSLADQQDPSLSPDGEWVAFESGGRGIEIARTDGGDRRVLAPDDLSAADPAWSPDGRHIAWASRRNGNADIYVAGADGSGVTRLTSDPAFEIAPAWSPDSRRIVFDRAGLIHEVAADGSGGARQLVTRRHDGMTSPSWSPDGRTLVLQRVFVSIKAQPTLYLARPQPDTPVDPTQFLEGAHSADWSSDGRVLFLRRGELWSIRTDGTDVRSHGAPLQPEHGPSGSLVHGWSHAAGRFAFGWDVGTRTQIYAIRPDGSGLRRLSELAALSPSFSPNGRRIAFFTDDPRSSTLMLMDVATGAVRRVRRLPVASHAFGTPTWAPNGRRLAVATRDGVFTVPSTGGKPRRVVGTKRFDRDPDWSPDGRAIAFTRRPHHRPDLRVVDLRTGRTRLLRRSAEGAAWSPDGRRIAYVNPWVPPYNVDVWTIRRDGTRPRRLTRHDDWDGKPEWSPDGTRIAFVTGRGIDVAPWLGSARIFLMSADRGERTARPFLSVDSAISWRR